MGWADCGEDSHGRPIGYAFEATCDHPGCAEKIDRGLGYACGGMHGDDEVSCERYFCSEHLPALVVVEMNAYGQGRHRPVEICADCEKAIAECGDFTYDDDEGWWVPKP